MSLSPALLWAILGLVLLVVEIFTLSFVFVFFGAAALLVALIVAATALEPTALQILLFAALGGASVVLFRKKVAASFGKKGDFAADKAKTLELTADIPPHANAKVEYQGVAWDAYNDSDVPLQKGQRVLVVDTEGIKLIVRPRT